MILSIVTVNMNDVLGLEKTITSVYKQSFKDFEHIVIDGDSNDGSKELIINTRENYSYWISEPDQGIYDAMNKGIEAATGDYILFLNSGDWLKDQDVLKRVSSHLSESDIVYGNYIQYYNETNQREYKGIAGRTIDLNLLFDGNSLPHPATFHRRVLFDRYGLYDVNLKIVSDWKFFLKAIIQGGATVNYIDIAISYFDMNGVSNSNEELKFKEHKEVLRSLFSNSGYDIIKRSQIDTKLLNSNRFLMLRELEKSKPAQKILSLVLSGLLFLFLGKKLSDLNRY